MLMQSAGVAVTVLLLLSMPGGSQAIAFRPPAIPLITADPYTQVCALFTVHDP